VAVKKKAEALTTTTQTPAAASSVKGRRDRSWFARLEAGQRDLDIHAKEWKRCRGLLLGLSPENVSDWAPVNLGWAAFETLVGICFQQVPKPIIRHINPEQENAAKTLTSRTKADFDLMRARYYGRLAIADVFWAGSGVIIEKRLGDLGLAVNNWIQDGKLQTAETPYLKNQRMVFGRVHPLAIIRDCLATMPDDSDAAWEAIEFYPTMKELKTGDYKISKAVLDALPKIRSAPQAPGSQSWTPDTGEYDEDEFTRVRCREVWDRANKRLLYIPRYSDEVILEKDWPAPLVYNSQLRFPWSRLFFNEHPDEAFCLPEMSAAAPQIEQFQVLFRSILRDAVSKWRKFVVYGRAFDKAALANLISGDGNSIIPIRDNFVGDISKTDIQKSLVYPVPDVTVKQDNLAVLSLVKGLVHEIFGAGDFASAGFRSTRSATEAAALNDFLKVRMNNRTENIDAFWKDLVTNHVLYLQQYLPDNAVAEIVGSDGVERWVKMDKAQIQGDFVFEVIAGSSQPKNTESSRQENLAFYQQTLPVVQSVGGNVQPLIEWIAPHYDIPQEIVQAIFSGHKQALMKLGQLIAEAHFGGQTQPGEFLESASAAVNTGLTPGDLKAIQSMAASQVADQQKQNSGQPMGLPGTNDSPQTIPAGQPAQ
jgi:hypothetical protein